MTLRHMRIFLEVCNNGCNATKAAEAQHMTQPAVSPAIKELEQHYGTILFDRIGRRLQLTEAGARLLEYAKRICTCFDDMEQQMHGWDTAGILRVGASITIGSLFLPACVKAFQRLSRGAWHRRPASPHGRRTSAKAPAGGATRRRHAL